MMWQYLLVFIGSFLFDVVPFPFPPAFSIMVPLQILFHLNPWLVIVIGVIGSTFGRYVLTLYTPRMTTRILKAEKREDIQLLGKKMSENGWKGQMAILVYSLLPIPTTPLFLAAGIARLPPLQIIPAFFIGKFTSDSIAVHLGKFASENMSGLMEDALSWKSIVSLILCILLLCALLFIDWRTILEEKKIQLNFKVWK